jgi:hypothetical protein
MSLTSIAAFDRIGEENAFAVLAAEGRDRPACPDAEAGRSGQEPFIRPLVVSQAA